MVFTERRQVEAIPADLCLVLRPSSPHGSDARCREFGLVQYEFYSLPGPCYPGFCAIPRLRSTYTREGALCLGARVIEDQNLQQDIVDIHVCSRNGLLRSGARI
jgi:hypothetical protein